MSSNAVFGAGEAQEVPGDAYLEQVLDEILPAVRNSGWARVALFPHIGEPNVAVLQDTLLRLSRRIGYLLPQSPQNNLVAKIEDKGADYADRTVRGHWTNAELSFHSDRSDLNLLLYVRCAAEGGQISVASYADALRQMEGIDPHAAHRLFEGFPFDLREDRLFKSIAWQWRPIMWRTAAGVRGHYSRRFILDSQHHVDCPRLTTEQRNILDAFQAALQQLRPSCSFAPQPGDLLVLDNYRVMHARSAFQDDRSKLGRLALRTWVAPFVSEPLPEFLHSMTGSTSAGTFRGGVGSGGRYISLLGQSDPTCTMEAQ